MTKTLYLERPFFWTETRDPEVWFRAVDAVSKVSEPILGSPRMAWGQCLRSTLSRRSAIGAFGATPEGENALLHGVGLFMLDGAGSWRPTPETSALLASWKSDPGRGLTELAAFLVRESPWLRTLLLRLRDGTWALQDWKTLRGLRRGLMPGETLIFHRHEEPTQWIEGLEPKVGGRWFARTGCSALAIFPEVFTRDKRRDDLSLAPLVAPLHLLESVGWLGAQGELALPADLLADLNGELTPAEVLRDVSRSNADIRGFVPVELALRGLLRFAVGTDPEETDFVRWMDGVMDRSISTGAVEVLAAEPGQARHGRGLSGDPARKLVRWVIHDEFNELFQDSLARTSIEEEKR